MSQIYELFRISLIEQKQTSFLDDYSQTREDFLKSIFSREWRFEHYKIPYYYKPAKAKDLSGPYILGRLGRVSQAVENAPPEEDFAEYTRERWLTSITVVDPSAEKDGQKFAIQRNPQVGNPYSLLRKFAKHLNETGGYYRYNIEIAPIFDADTFWQFAAENRGDIVSLTFDFVVPNGLWSAKSSLKEELAQARESMKAQEVSTTIKSQAGLETNSDQIKESVQYAETGSGKIKARTRHGKTFNSTTRAKSTTVIDEAAERGFSALGRAAAHMAKILGHE